ncbi:MAG: hypothetical protein V3T05_04975 [Myxococcota bacterium]
MTLQLGSCAALLLALSMPATGSTKIDLWPFKSKANVLLEQARLARERSEFRLAQSLIEEAETVVDTPTGRILHEKGLLARARGQLNDAAKFLDQAADRVPASEARADQAAVLVQLGRWPEAVSTLRRAFDERGAGLRSDRVVADRRFVKLADFEPYKDLIQAVREEQSGPIGRLLFRLERIEASARVAADVLERVAVVMTFFWRLATALGAAVVALILLGLVATFGVTQLGMVRPPWTLVAGMTVASALWHVGARVATAEASSGWQTIGIATAVVYSPWLLYLGGRWFWLWRRGVAARMGDPYRKEHIEHTLALLDEVARLGKKLMEAKPDAAPAVDEDLRRAARSLRERLN